MLESGARKWAAALSALLLAVFCLAAPAAPALANGQDLPDQTLVTPAPVEADGWAAGATGGLGGRPSRRYVVSNRQELVAALGGNNETNGVDTTPAVIYVRGTVNLSADENNNPLGFADYKAPGYDFEAYLLAYAPATWGRRAVTGPLEDARRQSQVAQAARIVINVGSNKSLIGLGKDAQIVGGSLMVRGENIVIRNIEFVAPYDYFPAWDPLDGSTGNWNSQYDAVSVRGATRVFVANCTFTGGIAPADGVQSEFFGRKYEHYDGLLDITHNSDLVTAAYNHFRNHDKTMLIGSSDNRPADVGKLRSTIHHNFFENTGQRLPRVRYGQVHVYNNYYLGATVYAVGVGVWSQIYSEANVFEGVGVPVYYYDRVSAPGNIIDTGSLFVGGPVPVFRGTATWNPAEQYAYMVDPADQVKEIVMASAGAGKGRNPSR